MTPPFLTLSPVRKGSRFEVQGSRFCFICQPIRFDLKQSNAALKSECYNVDASPTRALGAQAPRSRTSWLANGECSTKLST